MKVQNLLMLGSIVFAAVGCASTKGEHAGKAGHEMGCCARSTDHQEMNDKDGDDGLKLEAAPPAVQAAIKKAAGTNTIEEIKKEDEDGKTIFEAKYEADGIDHTLSVSPDGAVLEEEAEANLSSLPAPVVATLLKTQPLGVVKSASMVTAGGKSFYEIDSKVGKEKHELQIAADGALIADRVEADEDKEYREKDGDKGWDKQESKHGEKDKD